MENDPWYILNNLCEAQYFLSVAFLTNAYIILQQTANEKKYANFTDSVIIKVLPGSTDSPG